MPEVPNNLIRAGVGNQSLGKQEARPRPDSSFLLMAAAELDKAGLLVERPPPYSANPEDVLDGGWNPEMNEAVKLQPKQEEGDWGEAGRAHV